MKKESEMKQLMIMGIVIAFVLSMSGTGSARINTGGNVGRANRGEPPRVIKTDDTTVRPTASPGFTYDVATDGDDTAVRSTASPGTTYYVATDGNDGTGDGSEGNPWLTISHALTQVSADDTIHVKAGTYVETGQLVIDKNLTIEGEGAATTTVKPASDTGSADDARGWWLVNADVVLHVRDLTFDGTGRQVYQGFRHRGSGTFTDCTFKEIKFPGYAGLAIVAFGGNVDVTRCTFEEIGRVGILYYGTGITGSVCCGSTYTGKGPIDCLDYAFEAGAGATMTVCNSTITDCQGVASDSSTSAGILVTTYYGGGSGATIEGNVITNCTEGIAVGYDGDDTSTVVAHYNNLVGNVSSAIGSTSTTVTVNAKKNWWGTTGGSVISGMIVGDVDYTPWMLTGAIRAGTAGNRLVDLQNTDGGWGWPLTGASAVNTIGPIAKGLAEAYKATHDPDMLDALEDAGTLLSTKINNFSPSDGYLALALDELFGGTTYVDHMNANFYGPLAAGTYDYKGLGTDYDTAGYVQLIRDSRASGGIANLAAWDIGMGLVGAASCGVSGSELQDWIDGVTAEIDELDGAEYYDVIGLAGAVYGLAFVGEDFDPTAGEHSAASDLNDLADILASYQITESGGFAWSKDYVIPNDSNETIQETAYAILALKEVGGYDSETQAAAEYIESVQLCTGGWENYVGSTSGENNEVTAEAIWGGSPWNTDNVLSLDVETTSLFVKFGDTVVVDMNVANLIQKVNACQAMLGYNSTYLNASAVPVAVGGGVWDQLIYQMYATPGEIDTAIGIRAQGATGTDADGKVAVITLTAGTTEGQTIMVFRPDLDPDPGLIGSTYLSDMNAESVWPAKVNSTTIVIDDTDPLIDITSAQQGGEELLGTATNALQGTVTITVEASDPVSGGVASGLAAPPTVTVTPQGGSSETATFVDEDPTGTFNYTWTVQATTGNGVATIDASVTDKSGNTSSDTDTFNINKTQVTGNVELEGFVGTTRDVTFVSTGTGDSKTWIITVDDFGSGPTGTYTLTDVPGGTNALSAKTAWHLRSKEATVDTGDSQLTADFTGSDMLLGGDLNGTNGINILDYSILATNWNTSNDVADIDGNGSVNTTDYSIMVGNWFVIGDVE